MSYLTEDEAKTKRCQEAFPAAYGLSDDGKQSPPIASHSASGFSAGMGSAAHAVYSQPHGGAPLYCLASACMAWRWEIADAGNRRRAEARGETLIGYCGKAGKP